MNEVEKKVKIGLWRQRIGYGSSDFACNLIWQMISLYLLYFYTNVMHLNAGAVSVMFLVTKVIDGISDLIVGFLIDKTNTKWGKSRPWILFGAVPFGVAAVLAFSVPDIGQTGMLIYAYITYILLSTAYTVVNIPMASILPALSEDPHERTVLASCRTFFFIHRFHCSQRFCPDTGRQIRKRQRGTWIPYRYDDLRCSRMPCILLLLL